MNHLAVLIAEKNGASIIENALNSVINQTAFVNNICKYNIIITSDAASIDNINPIISKYKNIIHVHANEPGLVITRNTSLFQAISDSRYTHFAVIDCDDIWLPTKIEKQLNILNNGIDVCGSGMFFVYSDGTKKSILYPENHKDIESAFLNGQNPIGHSSVVFSRRVIERTGGYWDTGVAEDYDLFSRAIQFFKFYNIQEELVDYNYDYDKRPISYKQKIDAAARKVYLRTLINYGIIS